MLRSNRLEGRRFLMLEQMGSSSHGMDKTWAGAWITQPQLQKNRQSLFMLLLPRKLFPPCSSHSKPLLTLPTPYLGLILFLICLKKHIFPPQNLHTFLPHFIFTLLSPFLFPIRKNPPRSTLPHRYCCMILFIAKVLQRHIYTHSLPLVTSYSLNLVQSEFH